MQYIFIIYDFFWKFIKYGFIHFNNEDKYIYETYKNIQ